MANVKRQMVQIDLGCASLFSGEQRFAQVIRPWPVRDRKTTLGKRGIDVDTTEA